MQNTPDTNSTILRYLQLVLFAALILYFGKTLFIPLFFGLLIAIVMYPVAKWLEVHGFNRAMAITVCLFIVALLLSGLIALFSWQMKLFAKEMPALFTKLDMLVLQWQNWLEHSTGVKTNINNNWTEKMMAALGGLVQAAFQSTVHTLFIIFITPVYTALFMYHRKILVQYLKLITPEQYKPKVDTILLQTIDTYFNYIKGMVLVYLVVGILNSIGLFLLGVEHAILFGMLCAIMTIIPYVGLIVSALLPITFIWMETGNVWYPIGVIAIFSFVQYLEANVIFPKVVGTQLHVSTLSMLVAIIAGGIIWGVAGMVLFIPFVAIFKIISDHIEAWKPINLLLSRK